LQKFADLDDGQRDLVAEAGGIVGQVAGIQLGVSAALLHDLYVGVADADAVNADKQLIVAWLGHCKRLLLAAAPKVLEASPVQIPGPGFVRQAVVKAAVVVEFPTHLNSLSCE